MRIITARVATVNVECKEDGFRLIKDNRGTVDCTDIACSILGGSEYPMYPFYVFEIKVVMVGNYNVFSVSGVTGDITLCFRQHVDE